jgi:hypothetical protein
MVAIVGNDCAARNPLVFYPQKKSYGLMFRIFFCISKDIQHMLN